jgi:hypothetical protein
VPHTDIKLKQHADGTWDFYIYDNVSGHLMANSVQHYENYADCEHTARRVTTCGLEGEAFWARLPFAGHDR